MALNILMNKWGVVEERRAAAFVIAGILYLISGILSGLNMHLVPQGGVLWLYAGNIALAMGLLGFYPELADRTPRLALAGVACIGLAVIAQVGSTVVLFGIAADRGVQLSGGHVWGAASVFGAALFVIVYLLAAGLLGIAILRTDSLSQSIGYLVLASVAWWVLLIGVGAVSGQSMEAIGLNGVDAGVSAVLFFAIGYVSHTRADPRALVGS